MRTVLAAAVVIAPLLTTTAAHARWDAEALAHREAGRAAAERWTDPAASAIEAVGAYQLHPDELTTTVLYGDVQAYRYLTRVLPVRPGRITALAGDPTDHLLFTFGRDGMVRAVSTVAGRQVDARSIGIVSAARYDRAAHALIAGDASGIVRSWPVSVNGVIGAGQRRAGLGAPIAGIAVGDNAEAVAVATDGTAAIIDLSVTGPAQTAHIGTDGAVRAISDLFGGDGGREMLVATLNSGVWRVTLTTDAPAHASVALSVTNKSLPGTVRQMAVAVGDRPVIVVSTTEGVYYSRDETVAAAAHPWPDAGSDLMSDQTAGYTMAGPPALAISLDGEVVAAAGGSGVAIRPIGPMQLPDGFGVQAPYAGAVDAITPPVIAQGSGDHTMFAATATGLILDLDLDADHAGLPPAPASTVFAWADAHTAVLADLATANIADKLYTVDVLARRQPAQYYLGPPSRPQLKTYTIPEKYNQPKFFVDTVDLDAATLVAGGQQTGVGGCVFVWNRQNGTLERTISIPASSGRYVTRVWIDPRLSMVWAQTDTDHLIGWPDATWTPSMDIPLGGRANLRDDPTDPNRIIASVPTVVGTVEDLTIDPRAGRIVDQHPAPLDMIGTIAGAAHERIGATAGGTIYRLDETGHPVGTPITSTEGRLRGLTVSPDRTRLAVSYDDGTVAVLDLTGPPIRYTVAAYNPQRLESADIEWSPDGRYLAISAGRIDGGHPVADRIDFLDLSQQSWLSHLCVLGRPALHAHAWARSAAATALPEQVLCQ